MVNSKLLDPLSRVNGVGDTNLFGAQYAIRIWLDPYKLNNYGLTVDRREGNAVAAQNAQIASGQLGQLPVVGRPAAERGGDEPVAPADARAVQPNIVLKSSTAGAHRLPEATSAHVQMGQDNYSIVSPATTATPAAGLGIKLAPGANALSTATAVKAKIFELVKSLPHPTLRLSSPTTPRPSSSCPSRTWCKHPDRGGDPGLRGHVHLPAEPGAPR